MTLVECNGLDDWQCFIRNYVGLQAKVTLGCQASTVQCQCADDIRMDGQLGTYKCRVAKDYQNFEQPGNSVTIGTVPVTTVQTEGAPGKAVSLFQSAPSAPVAKSSCAKDPQCFDKEYSCESCCSSGVNADGLPCWKTSFNPAACCVDPSGAINNGAVQLFASDHPAGPLDSRGHAIATDNRGYPAKKDAYDSRGRPLPGFDDSRSGSLPVAQSPSSTSLPGISSTLTIILSVCGCVAAVCIGVAVRLYKQRGKQAVPDAASKQHKVVPVAQAGSQYMGETSTRRHSADSTHSATYQADVFCSDRAAWANSP